MQKRITLAVEFGEPINGETCGIIIFLPSRMFGLPKVRALKSGHAYDKVMKPLIFRPK
jgi:hypothetical protein